MLLCTTRLVAILCASLVLLGVLATPAMAAPGGKAPAACRKEAVRAGFDPKAFTIIAGTEGDDTLIPTGGADLICGFGGNDSFGFDGGILDAGDVFLGGDGNDHVLYLFGGTFNGGAGDDGASFIYGGTFNGGDGNDSISELHAGTFNGGAGDDWVSYLDGGTFNGGDGNDYILSVGFGGTFNQEGL